MPSRIEFAARLRRLMEERGLNERELARLCNVKPCTIYGYTNANRFPTFKTLWKIHNGLGCEWGDLLGD